MKTRVSILSRALDGLWKENRGSVNRVETGIKDGFEEMEYEFPFRISDRTTFSDVPLLPEIFRWIAPKGLFYLLFNRIFRKLFVNGKHPWSPIGQKKFDRNEGFFFFQENVWP